MRIRFSKTASFIAFISPVHKKRHTFISISYFFDRHSSFWSVMNVSALGVHFIDCLVICGYHVKLGIPASFGLSDCLFSVFLKPHVHWVYFTRCAVQRKYFNFNRYDLFLLHGSKYAPDHSI